MKTLVTGGHGFIGSHLCERLITSGSSVRILARPESPLQNLTGIDVEVVRGDLNQPETLQAAVAGCTRIYHLAGALKGLHRDDLFRVNAEGTRNLAEAAARYAPSLERFVYVSSLAAAGPSPGGSVPVTEEASPRPVSWYGESKLAGEEVVRSFKNLPWTIVRPPVVFGPREKDLYTYFRIARRGWLPVLGRRERHYSLIFGPDLADGIVRAAETPKAQGQIYFISGPEAVGWGELGMRIAEALGVRGRVLRIPDFAGRLAGVVADVVARGKGRAEIFGGQKVIEMLAPAWVCSPEKAERDLGWKSATPLSEALCRTVAWYRAHGWL
ncbi:MAG: NAD-dependent epimerase/dehydratase family protein [Pseudomonadota bacterium]